MAVDCGIYPGPNERPLPDQPGSGKVRIGVGGVPVVFTGNKCDNNFSNCAGNGAALGANNLYIVPNTVESFKNRIYLGDGFCVELDSTGCSGSCAEFVDLTLNVDSLGISGRTYTLSGGNHLPTGYQTADVVSTGITGEYTCWWGSRFGIDSSSITSDISAGFLDITLAKNPTFVEALSGDVGNLESKPGNWVIMLRPTENNPYGLSSQTVFYYENELATDNISGDYVFLGRGGGDPNFDMSNAVITVNTSFVPPDKPCPNIETNVPTVTKNREVYRFNKCQIAAFKIEPNEVALVDIKISNYLADGSNAYFFRFYGTDETFTYQEGPTLITSVASDGDLIYTFLSGEDSTYYFTLQNQDDDTNRFSYNINFETRGSPGNFDQAVGPVLGNPLDAATLCPAISAVNVLLSPISAANFTLTSGGSDPNPGNFDSALGPAIIIPIPDTTCPCIVVSDEYNITAAPSAAPLTFLEDGSPANPGDMESLLGSTDINQFAIQCHCVSGGESVIFETVSLIPPEALNLEAVSPGAAPSTNLSALVTVISSGLSNCECDPNQPLYVSAATSPVSSTSIYISGGLDYEDVRQQFQCIFQDLYCFDPPGPQVIIPITGANTKLDYDSNSYLENGYYEYEVTETGGISAICIHLDGDIDFSPTQVTFRIQSPRGLIHDIPGVSLGNGSVFEFNQLTTALNGDGMQGTWKFSKLDLSGNGGLAIADTSTVTINPISGCGGVGDCGGETGSGVGTIASPLVVNENSYIFTNGNINGDDWTYFVSDVSGTVELGTFAYGGTPASATEIEYYGNDQTYTMLEESENSGFSLLETSGETGCIYFRVRDSVSGGSGDFIMSVY